MSNIIKILFEICFLRKGPEDLPGNTSLMIILMVLSLAVSMWLGLIIYDKHITFISSIVGLFFSYAFTKILLINKPERFVQTFSAMLGTVTLINLLSLPIVAFLADEELNENIMVFLGMLSFALFIWVIAVYGFIFSRASSSSLGQGIAYAVLYAFLSIIILEMLLVTRVSS